MHTSEPVIPNTAAKILDMPEFKNEMSSIKVVTSQMYSPTYPYRHTATIDMIFYVELYNYKGERMNADDVTWEVKPASDSTKWDPEKKLLTFNFM